MEKKKLVIGVIGADVHAVGIQILYHAFSDAGFDVTNLGVMVSQEEYIAAAIESGDTDVTANVVVPLTPWSGYWDLRDLSTVDSETWPNHSMAVYYGIDSIIGE